MTINERVSDERIASVIETLEHYATNLKWAADHSGPDLILAATALRELQQYRAAAEPVLYCMEGDALDEENVSTSKAVVDAWVEEWNGEGRCPGEPQYRTVPLYRHAAPQVTSAPGKIDLLRAHYNYDGNDFEVRAYQRGWNDCVAAAPAVQAEQLSGNTEQVSQPTLPKHSPCADAPDHIWLQTAGEWPASGEFSELTWSCDNQHPDDTLYVRADLVGKSPGYLQGYKDGCEWAARMAEANHPQTGDWLFDDPIELAKAIHKGPDMLPVESGNSAAIQDSWIPVSERMPESAVTVLISNGADIGKAYWLDEWGYDFAGDKVPGDVTHWMPLPAAPQQEAE